MRRFVPLLRKVTAYLRLRRDAAKLAKSALFDAAWYRAANADLGHIGRPALHYLRRGAAEGRHPSPEFDGDAYRARYPDVDMSDANPLLHYLRIGLHERRVIFSVTPGLLPRLSLNDANYQRWIAAYGSSTNEITVLPRHPVFLVTTTAITPALRISLEAQIYPHWRLVAADDDGSLLADPDWDLLLRLPADCQLAETALLHLAAASDENVSILHADHDLLNSAGVRHAPRFHAMWEPDLGQPKPKIRAISRAALQNADLPATIRHVPRILFHCAIQQESNPAPIAQSIASAWPLVSVIIPSGGNTRMLARCVRGILTETDYPNLEIIIVNNARHSRDLPRDPRIQIVDFPGIFNWSAMNNAAAQIACGEILLLLNDDVAVMQPGWLKELVALAMRPDIGIVGAKLLYPNSLVQHAGISLGTGAVARHLFRHARANDPGHADMLSQRRSVAAVTGACLAIRRTQFHAVGGLEEQHLGVTNGDIDLCLRVRAHGQRVVWTPFAVLEHHEAATRGLDITHAHRARLRQEREYLLRTWGAIAQTDPYLNPNLGLVGERLALASPPRLRKAVGSARLDSPRRALKPAGNTEKIDGRKSGAACL